MNLDELASMYSTTSSSVNSLCHTFVATCFSNSNFRASFTVDLLKVSCGHASCRSRHIFSIFVYNSILCFESAGNFGIQIGRAA